MHTETVTLSDPLIVTVKKGERQKLEVKLKMRHPIPNISIEKKDPYLLTNMI